jgi:hypothetical protein
MELFFTLFPGRRGVNMKPEKDHHTTGRVVYAG